MVQGILLLTKGRVQSSLSGQTCLKNCTSLRGQIIMTCTCTRTTGQPSRTGWKASPETTPSHRRETPRQPRSCFPDEKTPPLGAGQYIYRGVTGATLSTYAQKCRCRESEDKGKYTAKNVKNCAQHKHNNTKRIKRSVQDTLNKADKCIYQARHSINNPRWQHCLITGNNL
jgi:hypothetical protein